MNQNTKFADKIIVIALNLEVVNLFVGSRFDCFDTRPLTACRANLIADIQFSRRAPLAVIAIARKIASRALYLDKERMPGCYADLLIFTCNFK